MAVAVIVVVNVWAAGVVAVAVVVLVAVLVVGWEAVSVLGSGPLSSLWFVSFCHRVCSAAAVNAGLSFQQGLCAVRGLRG